MNIDPVRADLLELRSILVRQRQTDFISGLDAAVRALELPTGLAEARAMLQSMYAGAGSLSDFYAIHGDDNQQRDDNARFEAAITRLGSALDC